MDGLLDQVWGTIKYINSGRKEGKLLIKMISNLKKVDEKVLVVEAALE